MNPYPEVVAKIVDDYAGRVRAQLRLVPAAEREEFLREIQSHVYEAYMQTPGGDEVSRILAVLAKFGEPADVVADRLPAAMLRSGAKRNLPLYIVGGVLIALFGIPLGFGGFGVLLGLVAALGGLLVAYYAVAGSLVLSGAIVALCGLMRIAMPELWERLISLGYIQMDGAPDFMLRLSASDEGLLFMMVGGLLLIAGWGLFKLGKKLLRGLRFLVSMIFDWMRRFAQSVRRNLRREKAEGLPAGGLSLAK